MNEQRIDLSPYLSRKWGDGVFLEPEVEAYLLELLGSPGVSMLRSVIADSVSNFFTAFYHNEWFAIQTVHPFVGLEGTDPKTNQPTGVVLHLHRLGNTFLIRMPRSGDFLPEYYDQRVIEEARVILESSKV